MEWDGGRQNASNGSLEHGLVSCWAVVIAVENIVFGKLHLFGELHPPGSFDEIWFQKVPLCHLLKVWYSLSISWLSCKFGEGRSKILDFLRKLVRIVLFSICLLVFAESPALFDLNWPHLPFPSLCGNKLPHIWSEYFQCASSWWKLYLQNISW